MFINNLNKAQQEILLKLSMQLISIDNIINKNETLMIDAMREQMLENIEPAEYIPESLSSIYNTKKEKSSLLLELLGLALADHEYHNEEKSFITKIADQLNVTADKLYEMEVWVQRQLSLSREAIFFMGE